MFIFIRLLIIIVVLCLFNYILYKKNISIKATNKFKVVLNLFIATVLVIVLSFFPFENTIVTFNTPEQAFKYVNSGTQKISLVVTGKESDFVIAEDDNVYHYLIIPKTNNGWKLGLGQKTKIIKQKIHDNIIVYVYQYDDTSDFFVTVFNAAGGNFSIKDNFDSKFYYLEQEKVSVDKTFFTYYAFVSEYDSNYSVTVNGKVIMVG